MPTKTFKVGDLVVLNSGGPLMTVEGFIESPNYQSDLAQSQGDREFALCTWFSGNNKESKAFAVSALEIGEKPKPFEPPTFQKVRL